MGLLNLNKSKFMILGFRGKLPDLGLYMYGSPLERAKEFKFLGLMYNSFGQII